MWKKSLFNLYYIFPVFVWLLVSIQQIAIMCTSLMHSQETWAPPGFHKKDVIDVHWGTLKGQCLMCQFSGPNDISWPNDRPYLFCFTVGCVSWMSFTDILLICVMCSKCYWVCFHTFSLHWNHLRIEGDSVGLAFHGNKSGLYHRC